MQLYQRVLLFGFLILGLITILFVSALKHKERKHKKESELDKFYFDTFLNAVRKSYENKNNQEFRATLIELLQNPRLSEKGKQYTNDLLDKIEKEIITDK